MKVTAAIIFVILFIVVTNNAQTCTHIQECNVTINGICYAHVDEALDWNQAGNCCVAWGGHLASIHSDATNILLNGIRNQDRWTWIGLSDTATDGIYVWTDGTPFDYENFAPSEPNNLNGESCFHFFDTDRGALGWNDFECNRSAFDGTLTSYICQKSELTFYS